MPNRIIKESICTSEKIASLSDFEFRLWVGLITQADDFGRGDARPAVIKGRVFPLKERLAVKDIDAALRALAGKGCVSLYTVDGKPYFYFPTWTEHQRIRDSKAKYPEPPKFDGSPQLAATRGNSRQPAANCGNPPQTAALIQSESESKSESESEEGAHAPARFAAPTVEEAAAYCSEHSYDVDPQQFVDFYASKGWKVGNQPMRDWRAAVRTWARRRAEEKKEPAKRPVLTKAHNHHQRTYTDADFAAIGIDLLED